MSVSLHFNFWTIRPIFTKHGINIMSPNGALSLSLDRYVVSSNKMAELQMFQVGATRATLNFKSRIEPRK